MMPSTARQMRLWLTANPKKSGESKRGVGFSHAEKGKKNQHFLVSQKITYIQFGSHGVFSYLIDIVVSLSFKTLSSVLKLA